MREIKRVNKYLKKRESKKERVRKKREREK